MFQCCWTVISVLLEHCSTNQIRGWSNCCIMCLQNVKCNSETRTREVKLTPIFTLQKQLTGCVFIYTSKILHICICVLNNLISCTHFSCSFKGVFHLKCLKSYTLKWKTRMRILYFSIYFLSFCLFLRVTQMISSCYLISSSLFFFFHAFLWFLTSLCVF